MTTPYPTLPAGVVTEIRTGRARLIGSKGVRSAIHKHQRSGPVFVGALGFEGDEQSDSFHGGAERAVLQYDSSHYEKWRAELPDLAAGLQPGGFGENLVVEGMSEANVCVGDIVRAGGVLLEVAELRQPCYKLDHRFGHRGMGRLAQQTGRVGWFYRVLETGFVEVGDRVEVIERPHEDWPLTRVHRALYEDIDDREAAETLSSMAALSADLRSLFARRAEAGEVEDWDGRLSRVSYGGQEREWRDAVVTDIVRESRSVISVYLDEVDGTPPSTPPGAHIDIRLTNALSRSYSTCPAEGRADYRIAVALAEGSRGGSAHLHEHARVGDRFAITRPIDAFPLADGAARHVFVAGGIGITPFLTMIAELGDGAAWELHYCVRDRADAAFVEQLQERYGTARVQLHVSGENGRLDMATLFATVESDVHIYCCGSGGFMSSLRDATTAWPEENRHFEAFAVPAPLGPPEEFIAELGSSGVEIPVPAEQTLLEALRERDIEVPSSCEAGTCGTCRLRVVSGEPEHNDFFLTVSERTDSIITCVSRARGRLVLDI